MGGEIVWSALDSISEYLRVQDAEIFLDGLTVMLDYSRARK